MMTFAAMRRMRGIFCAALLPGLLALVIPETVYGAEMQHRYLAKAADAAPLPMFVAVALGIAVAVFAVIAFLHLTKGRNTPAAADGQETRRGDAAPRAPDGVSRQVSGGVSRRGSGGVAYHVKGGVPRRALDGLSSHASDGASRRVSGGVSRSGSGGAFQHASNEEHFRTASASSAPFPSAPVAAYHEDDGAANPDVSQPDYTIPLSLKRPALKDADWRGKPRIYGLGGEFAGESFRVGDSGLSIGRDPAVCHIVFPSDAGEISRRHCTIRYESDSGTFYLEDHGSSNGTFLPGGIKLIPGKSYPMKAGDRFALSGDSHWFEFRD